MLYLTSKGIEFLREEEDKQKKPTKKKTPHDLKGKALAAYLRQKDIEGLGFKGPMGRG